MAGHKKFSTLLGKMSPERRAHSDARVQAIRQEMLLAERLQELLDDPEG